MNGNHGNDRESKIYLKYLAIIWGYFIKSWIIFNFNKNGDRINTKILKILWFDNKSRNTKGYKLSVIFI